MKRKGLTGKRHGFAVIVLLELLLAVAVTAGFVALLVPAVSKVMEETRQNKGAKCLKDIAVAYSKYKDDEIRGNSIGYGDIRNDAQEDRVVNAVQWAIILAREGYLNDPNTYICPGDSIASRIREKEIIKTGNMSATLSNAWDRAASGNNAGKVEFSVWVVAGIPEDAPVETTPIALTRGLDWKMGKWTEQREGVYGNKGGYIAFLDGHVSWFGDLGEGTKGNPGKLIKWGTKEPTSKFLEAIPQGAYLLNASGTLAKEGKGIPVEKQEKEKSSVKPGDLYAD